MEHRDVSFEEQEFEACTVGVQTLVPSANPEQRQQVVGKRQAAGWVYVGTHPGCGAQAPEGQSAAGSDWTVMVFVKRRHR